MTQYIDKAAVVAELNKLYDLEYDNTSNLSCGKKIMLRDILLFLDTLEVKEVDLKEEIDKFWKPRFSLGWDDKSLLSVSYKGFEIIAKHFFELGLKAQKEE